MITGSIVALVTPMDAEGNIDWQKLTELLEWHIEEGTSAIVPVGTTGESATLTIPEHCQVIAHAVRIVNGRVPIIAGTGGNATQEAIELTEAARGAGADACLSVTPYYNRPTQEGLFLHYQAIVNEVDLPLVLYNVPGRTACDMLAETVARLSELPGIVGIKEATGDLERGKEVRALCGEDFAIYSGDDATSCDLMLDGANGTISVTANVAPQKMSLFAAAALANDRSAAKALDAELQGLHQKLFLEANPIPVKWALAEMGRISAGIRLPMTHLSVEHHEALREAMRQAGAIN